jgi:hypothetical protein
MSEYGWTPQFVLEQVTPAQAALWAERISRRRRTEAVLEARLTHLAIGGALHADNRRAFEQVLAQLLPGDDPGEAQGGPGERRLDDGERFRPVPEEPNPAVERAVLGGQATRPSDDY